MIRPISFKSTYKVENADKLKNVSLNKMEEVIDKYQGTIYNKSVCEPSYITYVVPDCVDNIMESYFYLLNIKFKKYSEHELFDEINLKKRLQVPPFLKCKDFKLVELKTDEFDPIFENTESYLPKDSKIDTRGLYSSNMEYLKSGEPIDAPDVYLFERWGNYLDVDFGGGRHKYAIMRDLGFKSIPFALDKKSIKIAEKYGLLA